MTRRIWWLPAAAALLLGACAEIPPPDQGRGIGQTAIASIPPAPTDSQSLVGRGAREIAELLGEPGFKRRDPPAELWRYRAGTCMLDLFLYADRGNRLTVAHAEIRPVPPVGGRTEEREISSAECLKRIRSGG